jgi:hypothetical protein
MRGQHGAPAQRTTARQRGARGRGGIILRRISPCHRYEAVEFGHLPGHGTPAPGPTQRERAVGDERFATEPQRRGARHRHALARALGAPGAEVLLQPHRLHAKAGHRETGLQPHVDAVAIQRELQKLQPRRAVRQRQETQFVPSRGDACGGAMRPRRQQQAAAHVELAGAEEHFALARQQRLSVQQNAHAGPIGDRQQRRHWRLGVGHVEQAGDVAARPRCPSAISEPSNPGRAPADRASSAHAQESVAEREAGFDGALGQDVVTLMAQEPARVSRRFQRLMHRGRSPCQVRATRRRPGRRC